MRVAWVLGWAIPESWFAPIARAAWPDADHVWIEADPTAISQLESSGSFDLIVGYSLGSLLLLEAAGRIHRGSRVVLLAPIFGFAAEEALGGRVPRAQLRYLTRWFKREPTAALVDFYARAGLDVSAAQAQSFSTDTLDWGLDQLATMRITPRLPDGWTGFCGANDSLLDARQLHALEPRIEIVPEATHHPAALIQALGNCGLQIADCGLPNRGWSARRTPQVPSSAVSSVQSAIRIPQSAILPGSAIPAAFDRSAPRYDAHARVQRAMAEWLAEWLPSHRSGAALELGAGTGLFTERLLPWSGPLLATDLSPAMCAAGRARLPSIAWRVMPAEAPPDGPWDWIFSSSMLQWATDPAAVFATWREKLSARGRILAGFFVDETLPELHSVLGTQSPVRWRSPAEWRAALAGAGFRLVRESLERRTFDYSSALALLRSLHRIGAAPSRRLTAPRLRQALRTYDREFATGTGVPATWTFYRLEAENAPALGADQTGAIYSNPHRG